MEEAQANSFSFRKMRCCGWMRNLFNEVLNGAVIGAPLCRDLSN